MLEWISQNNNLVIALSNIGTLMVWLFYAQLLYSGFRRQRRPRLLINKGVGNEYVDSPCLVCNMSQEPVFVFLVVVQLRTSEELYTVSMTDCSEEEWTNDNPGLFERTRQGPLQPGHTIEFVTFRQMISRISQQQGMKTDNGYPCDPDVTLKWLEIHVISIYGSDDAPFGAVRRFDIMADDHCQEILLRPAAIDTSRHTSWRYRRSIRRWLDEFQ